MSLSSSRRSAVIAASIMPAVELCLHQLGADTENRGGELDGWGDHGLTAHPTGGMTRALPFWVVGRPGEVLAGDDLADLLDRDGRADRDDFVDPGRYLP